MARAIRFPALMGALLTAIPAVAQQPTAPAAPAAPACDVETMSPTSLAKAAIARNKVVTAKTPDDGLKGVRDAMKDVFDKESKQNPLGQDYVAAQFLLLAVDFGGEVQARGDLNVPGDKKEKIDLLAMSDSLLNLVETAKPLCKEETTQWREYKPYAHRIELAYTALQANKLDSAEYSANRALIMSRNAPQAYDVLWRVAAARNDKDSQVKYLKMTIDKLVADTANAHPRANLTFNLGRIEEEIAQKATDPARKAAMFKASAESYLQVIKEYPASEEAPFAINGISVAWALSNDSTDAIKVLELVKPNLEKLNDMALNQAAAIAVRMNKTADAAAIFKAATQVNPYSRDYLYNYAATLFDLRKSADMIPIVQRLLALDPSNSDNVLLYAYAYKGLADSTKDAASKKAFTDSAVYYSTKSDGMKTKLSYTSVDRGAKTTTIKGEIENRALAARTYNVEFEFLDRTGAVVDKKAVTVGPLAPNATGQFTVDSDKGGVAGVRYAPIP